MKFIWDKMLLFLWLVSSCTCTSPGKEAGRARLLDQGFSSLDNLQSWNDWLAKRGIGGNHWDVGQLPPGTFQNWQEWLSKRGFASPSEFDNFGVFDNSKFQEWKDWVSKRGLDSGASFAGFNDLDKNQLQQWNDWFSKRYFDMGAGGFVHGPNAPSGLQNWADFVKRQSFMFPSSEMGLSGNAHFQNWNDWVKRMSSDRALGVRGYRFGNKDRFIKRQLGLSPDRYGSFNRYFTDGLQDWRSTFKGSKRSKDQSEQNSVQQ